MTRSGPVRGGHSLRQEYHFGSTGPRGRSDTDDRDPNHILKETRETPLHTCKSIQSIHRPGQLITPNE